MNTLDEINKVLDRIQKNGVGAVHGLEFYMMDAGVVPDWVKALRRALPSRPGRRPADCARLRKILSLLEGGTE